MKLFSVVEKGLERLADGFFAVWPQPFPDVERLKRCQIVSHRGEYDNLSVFENTLPAFARACAAGVWGIEFDIRWTKDLHPVVVHDPDLRRVFDIDLRVGEEKLTVLKSRCRQVPTLSEVIQHYGRKMHLMAEIKAETYPDVQRQNRVLQDCFANLRPQTDYHLMSLAPEMFDLITFVPASTFIPIAIWNLSDFSKLALEKKMAGIAGHYFLLKNSMISKHRRAGQLVGTGYPASGNCLSREIKRGVEWIFSNNAAEIQAKVRHFIETNSG